MNLRERIKEAFENLVTDYRYWNYMRPREPRSTDIKWGEHVQLQEFDAEKGRFVNIKQPTKESND